MKKILFFLALLTFSITSFAQPYLRNYRIGAPIDVYSGIYESRFIKNSSDTFNMGFSDASSHAFIFRNSYKTFNQPISFYSKVGIGTTAPQQNLTVGTGNFRMPVTLSSTEGVIYMGDTSWQHKIGIRSGYYGWQSGRGMLMSGTTNLTDNYGLGYRTLYSNSSGNMNIAIGSYALLSNTSGSYNAAIGYEALKANTSGVGNIANGYRSLTANTTGNKNYAQSDSSLLKNTTGKYNIAIGTGAMLNNVAASYNIAIGVQALQGMNVATYIVGGNVAIGYQALYTNNPTSTTNGINNTAIGYLALNLNQTGIRNTAVGYGALQRNTQNYITAIGYNALTLNTTGEENTAVGHSSLAANVQGTGNTAVGYNALANCNSTGVMANTALGRTSQPSTTTGIYNVAVGYSSLATNTTGSYHTMIGSNTRTSAATGIDNTIAVGYNIMTSATNEVIVGDTGNYAWHTDKYLIRIGTTNPATNFQTALSGKVQGFLLAGTTSGFGEILLGGVSDGTRLAYATFEWDVTGGVTILNSTGKVSASRMWAARNMTTNDSLMIFYYPGTGLVVTTGTDYGGTKKIKQAIRY